MKIKIQRINFIFFTTAFLLILGCGKTSIDEIPSYIQVDTISINVNSVQGTASQKITDVWVNAGNDLIGAFELPAQFPLLKSGSTQLSLFAGVKLNGINETRAPYPFYDRIIKTINLEREKVTDLGHLKFAYAEKTKFEWQENFEQDNLSIEPTSRSEIKFSRTLLPELKAAFPGEINEYAAKVVISNDTLVFEAASHNFFKLPTDGSAVFLEMNYKSNNPLSFGVIVNGAVTSNRPVLILNPSSKWNKIYINLTPTLSNYSSANSFKIYFSSVKSTEVPKAEIYFDNIKLLHF